MAVRQDKSNPLVEAFKVWCEHQLASVSGKSDLAKAIRYGLNRWGAFTLFLGEGQVAIDDYPAERAIKPVVLGRRNFSFCSSDAGGETLADALTVIETAKLHNLDAKAYPTDVSRIYEHMINQLDQLLPWNWQPLARPSSLAARSSLPSPPPSPSPASHKCSAQDRTCRTRGRDRGRQMPQVLGTKTHPLRPSGDPLGHRVGAHHVVGSPLPRRATGKLLFRSERREATSSSGTRSAGWPNGVSFAMRITNRGLVGRSN